MQGSVTVHMSATPEDVWAVISDVTRIGEFSPETFEAAWLDGATGPELGARFRGHVNRNKKGLKYWTTCRVVGCEPGRTFAFAVEFGGKPANTWRYEIAPVAEGVDVTESFTLTPTIGARAYWALAGRWRGRTNERGMRTTLERIKAVVEQPA